MSIIVDDSDDIVWEEPSAKRARTSSDDVDLPSAASLFSFSWSGVDFDRVVEMKDPTDSEIEAIDSDFCAFLKQADQNYNVPPDWQDSDVEILPNNENADAAPSKDANASTISQVVTSGYQMKAAEYAREVERSRADEKEKGVPSWQFWTKAFLEFLDRASPSATPHPPTIDSSKSNTITLEDIECLFDSDSSIYKQNVVGLSPLLIPHPSTLDSSKSNTITLEDLDFLFGDDSSNFKQKAVGLPPLSEPRDTPSSGLNSKPQPTKLKKIHEDDGESTVCSASSSVEMDVSSWDISCRSPSRSLLRDATSMRVRNAVVKAVQINHAVRYMLGEITKKGMRKYVLSDADGCDGKLSPGQTHPKAIMRIINTCAINEHDLVVDIGSGEGAFAAAVAAITGCEVYGAEIAKGRHSTSLQLMHRMCTDVLSSVQHGSSPCSPPKLTNSIRYMWDPSAADINVLDEALQVLRRGCVSGKLSNADKSFTERVLSIRGRDLSLKHTPRPEFLYYGACCEVSRRYAGRAAVPPRPLCERVHLEHADVLDVLRRPNSPLLRARIVFANNFNGRWGGFDQQVLRLVSRLMPEGSILVCFSRLTAGRRSDGVLFDRSPAVTETFRYPTVYFEVSGGWQGPKFAPSTDDELFPACLLDTDEYDDAVQDVWKRGRGLPHHEALRYILNQQQSFQLLHQPPTRRR